MFFLEQAIHDVSPYWSFYLRKASTEILLNTLDAVEQTYENSAALIQVITQETSGL